MSRTGRNSLFILLIVVLLAAVPLSAVAAEGGDEGGQGAEVTTTTINSGLVPAVELGGDEASPPPVDWTYRYMVPTGLALAALIIIVTAVKYFTDVVRKRYRIIEE